MRACLLLCAVCALACSEAAARSQDAPSRPRPLKGQLHLHTDASGDSSTPIDEVVRFYARAGYDFIVVTDHNHVTKPPAEVPEGLLVVPGVELTRNTPRCKPRPERKKCLVHMTALFAEGQGDVDLVRPREIDRLSMYLGHMETVRRLGGLGVLVHPNFAWTVDAELATELARRGLRLMEVANQGHQRSNAGDARHPSVEAVWDAVLTAGVPLWGVATDDAHQYDGGGKYPADRGWVMVNAERDPASIRAALERGDFYASTGVTLNDVRVSEMAITVAVEGTARIECIGERGAVLASTRAAAATCSRQVPSRYVRVRVTDDEGRQAWTQPVFRATR